MTGSRSNDERHLDLARRMLAGEPIDWDKEEVAESEVREGMKRLGRILGPLGQATETDTLDAEQSRSESPGNRFIGPFRIVRKLGEGGMGIVYEAEQQHPRRAIALKVIRGGAVVDETRVKMFQREAQTLARLKHPSIAAIYEMGRTDEGQHFFAMDLVRGETLNEWTKRARADLKVRLGLFRKICDAVAYAHQRGVIHRDLKPSNILVLKEPSSTASASGLDVPDIKILDFGLARITDTDVAMSTVVSELGTVRGTLPYMSPEQVRGNTDEIDLRTDVYSLGVILYELLTSQLPYDVTHGSLPEAVRVICEEPPKPLTKTWSGTKKLDADVATIALKALEKEPSRRYQSAAAVAEDIQRYLSNQPIVARPPSATYQLRKLVARHKLAFGFMATLFVVLTAFAVTMTVQARRIAAERDRADSERKSADKVSNFLASMLGSVNPQELGDALWKDLHDRMTAVRRGRGEAKDTIDGAIASLDAALAGVNGTDAALHLLDDQILTRAGQAIERDLGKEPRVAERLERTLCDTYYGLGLLAPAEQHAMRAMALGKQTLGSDHPETLNSMMTLANVYAAQGRYDETEKLLHETLDTQRRVLGNDNRSTVGSMHNLASVYLRQGKFVEAEKLYRETLEISRRVNGEEHQQTLATMQGLGFAYDGQGRHDEAEKVYRQTLEIQRRVLGPEHPDTLRSMGNLATVYSDLGRHDEAETLKRETLEIFRRVLGREHPDTIRSMYNLACEYVLLGRFDEGESLHRETLELSRRVLGEDHPDTLDSAYNLSALAARRGRRKQALDWLSQAVEHGYANADGMAKDDDLKSLRGDPEFEKLVARARKNAGTPS